MKKPEKNCAKNREKNYTKIIKNIEQKFCKNKGKSNTSIPLWQVKFYRIPVCIRDPNTTPIPVYTFVSEYFQH